MKQTLKGGTKEVMVEEKYVEVGLGLRRIKALVLKENSKTIWVGYEGKKIKRHIIKHKVKYIDGKEERNEMSEL